MSDFWIGFISGGGAIITYRLLMWAFGYDLVRRKP